MGNESGKQKGHSLQSGNAGGPPSASDELTREQMAAKAEERLNKKKPKKTEEARRAERFKKYEELDKAKTAEAALRCPHCPYAAGNETGLQVHIQSAHAEKLKDTNTNANSVQCPLCSRSFASESLVDSHIERDHVPTSSAAEREQRARLAEARLAKTNPKVKSQALKDEHWQRYNAIGSTSPTELKRETSSESKRSEDMAKELDVDMAIKNIASSNLGRPEVVQASLKMIAGILSKVVNPPEPEQLDKFRKININNEKVREKIVKVAGAVDLLQIVGFKVVTFPSATGSPEDYLFCQNPNISLLTYTLEKLNASSV